MNKALEKLIGDLNKKYSPPGAEKPVIQLKRDAEAVDIIPCGSYALSFLLGGGWYKGKMHEMFGPEHGGKALAHGEPVLTPGGWVPIESLEVGDPVMGSDGLPHRVMGVYPQGDRDIYRVTFSDGVHVDCTADHLWGVASDEHRTQRWRTDHPEVSPWRTMTTGDMASGLRRRDGVRPDGTIRRGRPIYRIPMTEAVGFPGADLPIHPYALGALLGDGSFTSGTPSLHTGSDDAIAYEVERVLDPMGVHVSPKGGTARNKDWSIVKTGGPQNAPNPVTSALKEIGLWKKTKAGKFVPASYLWASADQRLALLQGLMDTDGNVKRSGIEFSNCSRDLSEAVVYLVRSLGGTASIRTRPTRYRGDDGEWVAALPSHRVCAALPSGVVPFRLARKVVALQQRSYEPVRTIVDISPAGRSQATCISVDAADSLYMTRGCVLTHNTTMLYQALLDCYMHEDGKKPVCYVDVEHRFNGAWAEKMGLVDGDNLVLIQPPDAEAATDMVHELVNHRAICAFAWDSIGGAAGRAEMQTFEDQKTMYGGVSAIMTRNVKTLAPICNLNNVTPFYANQLRADMEGFHRPMTPGGHAVKHAMSVRIYLRRGREKYTEKTAEGDVQVGYPMVFKTVKNTFGPSPREQWSDFYFEPSRWLDHVGFDHQKDLQRLGILTGVFEQSSSWYYYMKGTDKEVKGNGRDAFFGELKEAGLESEVAEKVLATLADKLPSGVDYVELDEELARPETDGPEIDDPEV